jgi:hypothetical protein
MLWKKVWFINFFICLPLKPIRVGRIHNTDKITGEVYTLIGTGNYHICLGADDGDSEHLTLDPALEAILEFLRFYKNKNYY